MKWFCLLSAMMILSSCATPSDRIAREPQKFASYSSAVQEKIRRGQVDVGFTEDMVLMALGKPDRRYARGELEVWAWTSNERSAHIRDNGRFGSLGAFSPMAADDQAAIETIRAAFKDGKVFSIDRIVR